MVQIVTDVDIEDSRSTSRNAVPSSIRRIDVTGMEAAAVSEYVESNVDTDRVSLEHRGARTYIVLDS